MEERLTDVEFVSEEEFYSKIWDFSIIAQETAKERILEELDAPEILDKVMGVVFNENKATIRVSGQDIVTVSYRKGNDRWVSLKTPTIHQIVDNFVDQPSLDRYFSAMEFMNLIKTSEICKKVIDILDANLLAYESEVQIMTEEYAKQNDAVENKTLSKMTGQELLKLLSQGESDYEPEKIRDRFLDGLISHIEYLYIHHAKKLESTMKSEKMLIRSLSELREDNVTALSFTRLYAIFELCNADKQILSDWLNNSMLYV